LHFALNRIAMFVEKPYLLTSKSQAICSTKARPCWRQWPSLSISKSSIGAQFSCLQISGWNEIEVEEDVIV